MRDDDVTITVDECEYGSGGDAAHASPAVLRVDSVYKSYNKRWAVQDVGFALAEGELIAVLGPSGAGKSTLFRCVTGLARPDRGQVWFDGTDINALKAAERRRIAVIFQDFNLVRRLTAFENVLGGRLGYVPTWRGIFRQFAKSDKLKAFESLERVGLLGCAHQRADTLSGGQQQRVAVARALAQEPRLIVADEPVASLDPVSAVAVMNLLRDIARQDGVAILCSLHQTEYARSHADRIIGMTDGMVILNTPANALSDRDRDAIYASRSSTPNAPQVTTWVQPG